MPFVILTIMESKQIKEIKEGFTNLFKDKLDWLDPEIKKEATTRYRHCISCTLRVDNSCSPIKHGKNIETGKIVFGCGCVLSAKVRSPKSKCPLGKWDEMKITKNNGKNEYTTEA